MKQPHTHPEQVLRARAGGFSGALRVLPRLDAEDIAQETALRFWVYSANHPVPHPYSWGRTTGYRLALEFIVWDDTRRKLGECKDDPTLLSVGAPSPEDALAFSATMKFAEAACRDDLDLQVLWEHILGPLSQEELAHAYVVTRALVAQRVVRLRKRLRTTIAASLVEPS